MRLRLIKRKSKRLFGSVNPVKPARLQFYDLFITDETRQLFANIETDTYMGEIKFETLLIVLMAVLILAKLNVFQQVQYLHLK